MEVQVPFEAFLNIRVNEWLAILRAENDVVIQLRVRTCHFNSHLVVSPLRGFVHGLRLQQPVGLRPRLSAAAAARRSYADNVALHRTSSRKLRNLRHGDFTQ